MHRTSIQLFMEMRGMEQEDPPLLQQRNKVTVIYAIQQNNSNFERIFGDKELIK